jgi:DNA-binding NarL/FixJ family response regulator
MKYAIILEDEPKAHFQELFSEDVTFFESDVNIYDIEYEKGDLLFIHFDSLTVEIDDLTRYLKELTPKVDIIALRDNPNVVEGAYLLKEGFKSYLNTRTNPIIMNQVLETIASGNVWVYPELMSFIVTKIEVPSSGDYSHKLDLLSKKEKEVATLVAEGMTNKKIAQTMNVAEVTVKKHLSSIFHKLEIKDRVSLVVYLK